MFPVPYSKGLPSSLGHGPVCYNPARPPQSSLGPVYHHCRPPGPHDPPGSPSPARLPTAQPSPAQPDPREPGPPRVPAGAARPGPAPAPQRRGAPALVAMEIGRGGVVSRSNDGGRLGSIPAGERGAGCQQGPPGDGRGTRKSREMSGQGAGEGGQGADGGGQGGVLRGAEGR